MRSVLATSSIRPLKSLGANPGFSISSLYVPTGRRGKLYIPDSLVRACRVKPVAGFLSPTEAPGMGEFVGSRTTPSRLLVQFWARDMAGTNNRPSAVANSQRNCVRNFSRRYCKGATPQRGGGWRDRSRLEIRRASACPRDRRVRTASTDPMTPDLLPSGLYRRLRSFTGSWEGQWQLASAKWQAKNRSLLYLPLITCHLPLFHPSRALPPIGNWDATSTRIPHPAPKVVLFGLFESSTRLLSAQAQWCKEFVKKLSVSCIIVRPDFCIS